MITPELILAMLNLLVAFAETVIGLRVLLKLMGALSTAPFVRWIYETSTPLLYPFEGMFPSSKIAGVPFTVEFSAIFALFAYMFIGYVLQEAIDFLSHNFRGLKKRRKGNKETDENEVI